MTKPKEFIDHITEREGLKVSVSRAQISEIFKITMELLAESLKEDLVGTLKMVVKYGKNDKRKNNR